MCVSNNNVNIHINKIVRIYYDVMYIWVCQHIQSNAIFEVLTLIEQWAEQTIIFILWSNEWSIMFRGIPLFRRWYSCSKITIFVDEITISIEWLMARAREEEHSFTFYIHSIHFFVDGNFQCHQTTIVCHGIWHSMSWETVRNYIPIFFLTINNNYYNHYYSYFYSYMMHWDGYTNSHFGQILQRTKINYYTIIIINRS